jgi:hypothetical protein
MADLQEVFDRMRETRKEIAAIRKNYRELLYATADYEEVLQKLNGHKLHKLQIETKIKSQMGKEFEDMEQLRKDLSSDAVLLSDLAISGYLKGEPISVTDETSASYEPVFNVKFKKA